MEITSKNNSLIKLVKKLHTKKARKDEKMYIIEGEKLIKDALISNVSIDSLFYLKDKSFDISILDKCKSFSIPESMMKFISTTESSPPLLAIAKIHEKDIKINKDFDLLVIVDGLQDPGNFGTILRTSEATGVNCVIATKGTVDLYNPKVIRSTMGSAFRLPVKYIENLNDFLLELKSDNWNIVLTSPYSKNNLYDLSFKSKTAFVIGNEGKGINMDLMNYFQNIKIPMKGKVESINTSIAVSIILYEVLRQRL